MLLMFSVFSHTTHTAMSRSPLNELKLAGDICLILMPFWLLRPRFRWTIVFPVMFYAIFFLCNIWHLRFWGSILPLSALTMTDNINGLLIGSITGLLQLSDLLFALPPLAIAIILCVINKNIRDEGHFSIRTKWITICGTILLFVLSQSLYTRSVYRSLHEVSEDTESSYIIVTKNRIISNNSAQGYLAQNGPLLLVFKIIANGVFERNAMRPLTEKETAIVADYLSNSPMPGGNLTDSLSAQNRQKNIVFIIVESLNASVVNQTINGHAITPTLNSLIASEGTVYSLKIKPQIHEGGSSDGQLIYHSGLLPIESGATALNITPYTGLISLQDQLQRRNPIAVFADNGNTWNQTSCFKKFGFPKVFTNKDFPEKIKHRGSDAAMFQFALNSVDTASQPFIMAMVTISMHIPFNDKGATKFSWITSNRTTTAQEADYLSMVTYFDAELNFFITGLKNLGIWDNTILVVASDHSVIPDADANGKASPYVGDIPVVFLAANTGMTRRIEKEVGQIDVYPTVLEIAGVENPEFGGVGVSMLDSTRTSFENIEAAQRVSELILRGNYFGSK